MSRYEYEVQGNYGGVCGWECLTTEETEAEAEEMLRCYDENEPEYPHRIVRLTVAGARSKEDIIDELRTIQAMFTEQSGAYPVCLEEAIDIIREADK